MKSQFVRITLKDRVISRMKVRNFVILTFATLGLIGTSIGLFIYKALELILI